METVIISKDKLLEKIKQNRQEHRKIFEDALKGWQIRVLQELEKSISDAKKGKNFRTYINLPQPQDHTSEYDTVIEQIEWNEEESIELSFHQFNQFVRDDWGWFNQFVRDDRGWKEDFLSTSSRRGDIE